MWVSPLLSFELVGNIPLGVDSYCVCMQDGRQLAEKLSREVTKRSNVELEVEYDGEHPSKGHQFVLTSPAEERGERSLQAGMAAGEDLHILEDLLRKEPAWKVVGSGGATVYCEPTGQ